MNTPRDYLGKKLRELRKQRGVTGQELALRIGYSQPGISKIEQGLLKPTEEVVSDICKALKVPSAERHRLLEETRLFLAEFSKWSIRSFDSAVESQKIVQEREARAKAFCFYNMQLVFGLLQTQDYMRAVFEAFGQWSPEDIEKAIAVRLKRQKIVTQTDKAFQFIIDERVLHPSICDRKVMREQVKALVAASRKPNIELRILPMDVKINALPMTSFAIFDASLVVVETLTHEMNIWTEPDVNRYVKAFAVIRESTLSVEETRKRLQA